MHVAVAGNIGSGKTTLTSMLSKHYGWEAHFEDADDNPYMNDFYEDMQRWSFNLQIYFLRRYPFCQESLFLTLVVMPRLIVPPLISAMVPSKIALSVKP